LRTYICIARRRCGSQAMAEGFIAHQPRGLVGMGVRLRLTGHERHASRLTHTHTRARRKAFVEGDTARLLPWRGRVPCRHMEQQRQPAEHRTAAYGYAVLPLLVSRTAASPPPPQVGETSPSGRGCQPLVRRALSASAMHAIVLICPARGEPLLSCAGSPHPPSSRPHTPAQGRTVKPKAKSQQG
jgi:hypothetical protein